MAYCRNLEKLIFELKLKFVSQVFKIIVYWEIIRIGNCNLIINISQT